MNKKFIPLILLSTALLMTGCAKKEKSNSGANPGDSTQTSGQPASGTVVSFAAADFPAANNSPFEFTKSGLTISVSKGYTGSEYELFRVYKTATFKISGAAFTKVDMTFSDYVKDTNHYDGGGFGEVSGFTLSSDKLSGSWSGNSTELTFTAANYQVRVVTFSVTLA
ncbi:MAG: hypothetical protein IJK27_00685 [Bacilli bacterium]|nr:hypothetical protein [Bacilli bacterium]